MNKLLPLIIELTQQVKPEALYVYPYRITAMFYDKKDFKKFVKLMPGKKEKSIHCGDFAVSTMIDGVKLVAEIAQQNICQKVEVGTKLVAKEVPVGEVEYQTVIVEEIEYEWHCPESILK